MAVTRQQFVDTAKKWIGANETDGSWLPLKKAYDEAVDTGIPQKLYGCRTLHFDASWHWCAMAIGAWAWLCGGKDGAINYVPFEMSVWSLQQFAKKNLCGSKWIPYKNGNKSTVSIGDLVVYDWSNSHTDTDHVGLIASVSDSGFTTIEGNSGGSGSGSSYLGRVVTRSVSWGASTLTGFIHCNFPETGTSTPTQPKELTEAEVKKIAQEVIDGKWGNGEDRKKRLTQAGYNYAVIQAMVNAMVKGETEKVEYETYTVVKGDTMYAIAKKYGITLESLIVMNPQIENPNLIYAGQKINVKKKTAQQVVSEHKIVKGDTFESIAKKYNITVAKLIELNVGKVLNVR